LYERVLSNRICRQSDPKHCETSDRAEYGAHRPGSGSDTGATSDHSGRGQAGGLHDCGARGGPGSG
jgi:hypothetical protein